jgi:hypothetical protein
MVLWAAGACLLTLFGGAIGRYVDLPHPGSVAAQLLGVVYLVGLLFCLLSCCRAAAKLRGSSAFQFLVGAILSLPALARLVLAGLAAVRPLEFGSAAFGFEQLTGFLPAGAQDLTNNFLAPIGLALLGSSIGRIIKHPNTLLAGAGFAIFFDIVVVTMGTVAVLMTANAALISAVSVGAGAAPAMPTLPFHPLHAGRLLPVEEPLSRVTIGPADVLFMAVFLSAVHRLGLARKATFGWMFGLLGLALVIVQVFAVPIPALAPMGIAVLIANARHAAFTNQERRDLKIGAVFAAFCATLMVAGARRFAPPPPPPPLGFEFTADMRSKTLFVRGVRPGSRAALAGVQPGDLVNGLNGEAFLRLTPDEIGAELMAAREHGGSISVRHRGGSATVTLPLAPPSPASR